MYSGRGAGRWAESILGACGLPYRPPAGACTAARKDKPDGTRSLPCLPGRHAADAAVWTRMAKALRASPPLGQRSPPPPPPAASAAARGGRVRSMSATDPVASGWGCLCPLGGDRRRGIARLLRGSEIRPKMSESDVAGPSAGWGGGGGWSSGEGGGGALRRGGHPYRAGRISGAHR